MVENVDVAIIMGSKSDWEIIKSSSQTLDDFGVIHECRILSAHRTPNELTAFLSDLEVRKVKVIIAAAGLAAHLGGVIASHTLAPVIGVPIDSGSLHGMDALLSMVQMPPGIPVAVMAIGKPGAINAALFAIQILSRSNAGLVSKLSDFRKKQAEKVLSEKLD